MKSTEVGKNLGYNRVDNTIYEKTREALKEVGVHVLRCSENNFQHPELITISDVYHLPQATVVLEGHHELESEKNPRYKYMTFTVAADSPAKEADLLGKLESMVEAAEKEPKVHVMPFTTSDFL